jgi:surface carbohydrate biosynthesis protein
MPDRTLPSRSPSREPSREPTRAPRVALIVDHPERDLAGLVLTALRLARLGVIGHLVPVNLQEREIWALAPDFVLFNYLRRTNERLARDLLAAGIEFGVLDTEGAVWPDPDEYASLLWKDVSLLRQARCVCMWGARLAGVLLERRLFTREQVVVTGCPRFDLYADAWRYLRDDVGGAEQRPRRRVLINTNFSISNPLFTTAEKCVALHRSVLGYAESDLHRAVEAETIAIPAMVRLAERLADTYPSIDIVIRPHPFEDPRPYAAAATGRRNLLINQSESIQAAIFGSSAIIQRSCTTAIEAGLAGVPAFSPQWIPAPFLMPAAEDASVPCQSFEELATHLDAVLDGSYAPSAPMRLAIAAVIRDCCFAADGRSHQRVTEAVYRVLQPSEAIDHQHSRRLLYGLGASSEGALTRAARHARHRLRLSPEWSFARMRDVPAIEWMGSAKYFDAPRVQRLVDRAQQLEASASEGIGDVVVSGADGTGADWTGAGDRRHSHARYAVTIAPRRSMARSDAQVGIGVGAES